MTNQTNNCLKIFLIPLGDSIPPEVSIPTLPTIADSHSFLYNPIPPNNIKKIKISNILIAEKFNISIKKFLNLGNKPLNHNHVPILTSSGAQPADVKS